MFDLYTVVSELTGIERKEVKGAIINKANSGRTLTEGLAELLKESKVEKFDYILADFLFENSYPVPELYLEDVK